jgi:Holliday junction resolvase RusA-like endonuclease
MKTAPFVTDNFLADIDPNAPNYERARTAIIVAYNTATGNSISPKTARDDPSLIPVVVWLNQLEPSEHTAFYMRRPRLTRMFSACLSSKLSAISQFDCDICRCGFPIVIIPIRIQPRSHQAATSDVKVAFKKAIASRLTNTHNFQSSRLCIHIVLAIGRSSKTGDVDNAAKLLLDSMKGVVFNDDEQVDHLSIVRSRTNGDEDFLFVRITDSTLNEHRDVLYAGQHHSWTGLQETIDLDDYI